ncbi:class I SAM-dependent methyltransferase [Tahibacter soli]|uniref:Class I SAM-dependent methyltransferase n=1 Tax=Tahibacter soli TaxID=2983605 RepID=A0A9X3YLD7_9GAMM|nr:class I SAM-dependent methyltransferase [Tahibacter soli]MDC8014571.1 class I SAM-dependent methyltransferase [Tahibacter soli]
MPRLDALRADVGILVQMLRGMPRDLTHAQRLEAFYAPQAAHYDAFRERLLQGRRELVESLPLPDGAHVVELGGGTGRNVEFFGERMARIARVDVVDLCPALVEQARRRSAADTRVHVSLADATTWRPERPVDCVYLSYALTMIPEWRAAIGNAVAMLKPGGTLGVVDFYVSEARPAPGLVRHGPLTRRFWPAWFGHDGVKLSAEPLAELRAQLPEHTLAECRASVPYLPLARVPYYRFVGRKPA